MFHFQHCSRIFFHHLLLKKFQLKKNIIFALPLPFTNKSFTLFHLPSIEHDIRIPFHLLADEWYSDTYNSLSTLISSSCNLHFESKTRELCVNTSGNYCLSSHARRKLSKWICAHTVIVCLTFIFLVTPLMHEGLVGR